VISAGICRNRLLDQAGDYATSEFQPLAATAPSYARQCVGTPTKIEVPRATREAVEKVRLVEARRYHALAATYRVGAL
jgi:hypothetical protein